MNATLFVPAAIAVGGHFGPRTNPNQVLQDGMLTDGALLQSQTLTPGEALVYQSNTVDTRPIIVVETTLRADTNGNTISYTYTGSLLTGITDPYNRVTTLAYTGGQLTSITDPAARTATLTHDANGQLSSITQPDPDGAGSLAAPVTPFTYDGTTHRLTKVTDPLNHDTSFTYGTHGRLTQVTHPDNKYWQLTALNTIGLPTGTSGNSLVTADPTGSVIDQRDETSTFRTDRFGNITQWTNPLVHETTIERNADGLPVRVTRPDPDGAGGAQICPVNVLGYDGLDNLVYGENPDNTTATWTYNSSWNLPATATDELSRTTAFCNRSRPSTANGYDSWAFTTICG